MIAAVLATLDGLSSTQLAAAHPVSGGACEYRRCLFLAFWIEPEILIGGLSLLGVGLIWHLAALKLKAKNIS